MKTKYQLKVLWRNHGWTVEKDTYDLEEIEHKIAHWEKQENIKSRISEYKVIKRTEEIVDHVSMK